MVPELLQEAVDLLRLAVLRRVHSIHLLQFFRNHTLEMSCNSSEALLLRSATYEPTQASFLKTSTADDGYNIDMNLDHSVFEVLNGFGVPFGY